MAIRSRLLEIALAGLVFFGANVAHADFPSQYFPAGRFDHYTFKWYTVFLAGLEEPSLFQSNSKSETVRFTWLRSFDNPVSVRIIFKTDSPAEVVLKVSDGAGGYEAGRLFTNAKRVLSDSETSQILEAVLFLKSCEDPPEKFMSDGAQWIFERKNPLYYCVIDDQSPKEGDLHEAGLLLLKLAGYVPGKGEVY